MLKIILPNKNCLKPCFGIERAFKKCLDVKDRTEFLIYRQLGHNKRLCNYLKKKGFIVVNDLRKVNNKKIIVGAHGINQEELESLKKNKIQFIDLTCPFVSRLLNIALKFEKKGYQVIIIGDKNHIEIKNVCSFLEKPIIVNDKKDIEKIHLFPKVVVLTQTTQMLEEINSILPIIKQKCKEVIYFKTRCPETEKRQEEAIKLAKTVDLVLVIGDKISKNANNLVKICRRITKTKLIQGKGNINKTLFHKIKKVGIIASASTPPFVVEEVIKCLKKF